MALAKTVTKVMLCVFCIAVTLYPQPEQATAMTQRVIFQHLRAIATNLELTPDQVTNLTKQQAATYIMNNYPATTPAMLTECNYFWNGIIEILLRDAIERRTVDRLLLFRSQIEAVYPNAGHLTDERPRELVTMLLPYLYGEPNAL